MAKLRLNSHKFCRLCLLISVPLWNGPYPYMNCTTSLYRGPLSLPLDMLEIYHERNIFRCGSFFFSSKIYGLAEYKSFNKVDTIKIFCRTNLQRHILIGANRLMKIGLADLAHLVFSYIH